MAKCSTSKIQRGFALLELIVVLAIVFAAAMGFIKFADRESKRISLESAGETAGQDLALFAKCLYEHGQANSGTMADDTTVVVYHTTMPTCLSNSFATLQGFGAGRTALGTRIVGYLRKSSVDGVVRGIVTDLGGYNRARVEMAGGTYTTQGLNTIGAKFNRAIATSAGDAHWVAGVIPQNTTTATLTTQGGTLSLSDYVGTYSRPRPLVLVGWPEYDPVNPDTEITASTASCRDWQVMLGTPTTSSSAPGYTTNAEPTFGFSSYDKGSPRSSLAYRTRYGWNAPNCGAGAEIARFAACRTTNGGVGLQEIGASLTYVRKPREMTNGTDQPWDVAAPRCSSGCYYQVDLQGRPADEYYDQHYTQIIQMNNTEIVETTISAFWYNGYTTNRDQYGNTRYYPMMAVAGIMCDRTDNYYHLVCCMD